MAKDVFSQVQGYVDRLKKQASNFIAKPITAKGVGAQKPINYGQVVSNAFAPKIVSPIPRPQPIQPNYQANTVQRAVLKPLSQAQRYVESIPKATLNFGKNIATKTVPTAVKTIASYPNRFGTAMGETVNRSMPFIGEEASLNKLVTSNMAEAEKNDVLATKLYKQGKKKQAQFLFNRSKLLREEAMSERDKFAQSGKALADEAKASAVQTGMATLGTPYLIANPMNAVIGGTLSAGIAAYQGEKDLYTAAGKGIGETAKYSGLIRYTAPVISGLVGKFGSFINNPIAQQALVRSLGGSLNIGEDELLANLEQRTPGGGDRLFSFAIGALMTGGKGNVRDWSKLKTNTKNTIVEGGKLLNFDIRPAGDVWPMNPNSKLRNMPNYLYELFVKGKLPGGNRIGLSIEETTRGVLSQDELIKAQDAISGLRTKTSADTTKAAQDNFTILFQKAFPGTPIPKDEMKAITMLQKYINTGGKPQAMSVARPDMRPSHQKLLEDAANANDNVQVGKILDSIPATDPYKSSMERLFRSRVPKDVPQTPHDLEAQKMIQGDEGMPAAGLSTKAVRNKKAEALAEKAALAERMGKKITSKMKAGIKQQELQTGTQGQSTSQVPEVPSQPMSGSGSSGNSITQDLNPKDPYFNVNRLNVSDKTKKAVAEVVTDTKPQIEKAVGQKLSNKEAIDVANNTAKTIRKAVTRKETLAWESAMLRARQLLADQATNGTVTKEYIDNLVAIKSQGTDIARKLQSLSIGADPKAITAKQAILEAVLKASKNADEVIEASKGVDFNDLKQSTAFYRKFIKPKAEDWVTLLRYNSMLSSPNTHIVNTSSNAQGTGIIAPIEKTLLGGVDFLKSKVTGSDRQYYAGEGVEYAKGYYSKIGEAAHSFADVMRGKSMIANPDVRDIPLTTSGKGRILENTLSFPLKMLEGADQFFQTMTKGGVERSLEYRASKGVKVANIDRQAREEAAKRLFRSDINLKEQGTVLNAIDQVTQTVFNLRNNKNPIVRTVSKFTFPFVKTPMNILKQGVEYSPAGFTTLKGASNKTEQFTKALLGTSIGIGSAILLGSDRISWVEPTNATQRDNFRAAGLQPYSVKIGDKWVSYSKLHPAISFNLALFAAVADAQKKQTLSDSESETVMKGLASWWGFFADQSYVKNIGDFVASSKGDLEGAARYISSYPQQLIPFRALMGWVTRIVDPQQRKVDPDGGILEKQLQQIATQIPGLSSKVPPRVNRFGQPIEHPNRLLNAISPNRVTTEKTGAKEYYDSTIRDSKANKEIKAVNDLKKEAINMYLTKDYEGAKALIKEHGLTITNRDIKTATTAQKTEIVEAYLSGDYDTAKLLMKQNNINITNADVQKKAKSQAIANYKKYAATKDEYYLNETKELMKKYGVHLTNKDVN